MITVYESRETNFRHNGLGVLRPSSCLIYEELNGEYSLTLKHPIDNYEKWKLLEQDRIVKANGQLFRIYKLTHSVMDNEVEVFAMHIFYDLSKNFIKDINIVDKTGKQALNHILDNTLYENDFTCDSDITKINSARLVRKNVTSVLIGDDENSFLNYWGGELKRDNFNFQINTVIGKNKGMKISYGKNLTGLTATFDMSNIVTRIVPVAFDGITLPEVYVDSDYVNNYAQPIVREVEFSDVKFASSPNNTSEEGFATKEEVYAELRRLSKLMFTNDKVDVPEINFNVDFVELSKTEQYKKYSNLETVELGDVVNIHHKILGINIDARVISYEFNCLTNRYDSIELGSFQTNIFTGINELIKREDINMQTITDLVNVSYENAVNEATLLITNGLGGYVAKTRDELLIMDSDDINTARNVWRWNINGLGFSSTGYNGSYGLAMTHDGQIVANRITAGELNGEIIRANSITTNHLQVEAARKIESSQSEEEVRTLIETALGSFEVTITDKYEAKIDDELNSLSNNYYTKVETESKIQQNATQIALTVAREEVQNMEIGGRNLIKNTPNILLQDSDDGNFNSCSLVDGANSVYVDIAPTVDGNVYGLLTPCEKLIKGEWYTISFEFLNDSGSPVGFYWYPSEQYSKKDYIPSIEGKWQKVSFTYQQTGSTSGGGQSYTNLFGFHQLKAGVRYAYTNLQLERGKIATSWSPSPSDYSTTTQMNSAITQKANEITTTVNANYTTLNDKFNNYPTTIEMNSAIQQKADSITSNVNMTKIAGVELLPQGFRRNSTSGYRVRAGQGQLNVNAYGLYVSAFRTLVETDFIAIDPGLSLEYFFFMNNTQGYNPLTYVGFEQYNWLKQEIGENAATIYVVQEKFAGYKTFRGTMPENSFDGDTRYIKLRWLVNWDDIAMAESYIHECSVKQLGYINSSTQIAQMADKIETTVSSVNEIGTRMSTAESKITQNANQIASKVSTGDLSSLIQQNSSSIYTAISSGRGVNGVGIDTSGLYLFNNNLVTAKLTEGKFHAYNSLNGNYMGYFGTNGDDLRACLYDTNTFSVYSNDTALLFKARYDRDASYGNATLDMCGGINFIQKSGQDVGLNQIVLGNDDRADIYGYHNLSIRAHNSLGFMDNYGLTHMFFATRTGSIVMKGTVYQNSEAGISTFSLLRSREVVNDYGYTTEDMVDSILTLETSVNVDENEDYSMRICSSENELVTKILGDSLHIDQGSVIAGLVETVKSLNNRILELESRILELESELKK